MKSPKRKAKRIINRQVKKKLIKQTDSGKPIASNDQNIYAGSEKKMLDIVVKLIVKIIKKEVGI